MQQVRAEGFIRGAFLITLGSLISRILGAAYRPVAQIPLGDKGLALVTPPNAAYMIILAISSTGINVAISRLVSQRLAVGDLRGARRVVHVAATILAVSGILFSLLLAVGAPWLAAWQKFPESTPGFLVLAPAILLVTVEVAFRGLYQGMQQMRPAATSMVVEQAGRVFLGLAGVFLLTPVAVNLGAAAYNAGNTVGILLGALYGIWIYLRQRPMAGWTTVAPGVQSWEHESFFRLTGKIMRIALPLSFLGAVLPLVQMADVSIIKNQLLQMGYSAEHGELALSYITNASQLRDLPLILAQALYVSLVPAVSESMAVGNEAQARHRAAAAIRITWLIGLPATVGLVAAARDAYGVLFLGPGWYVMAPLGWSTVFLMLAQTSSGILQGLGLIWLSVINQLVGVVAKVTLTYWWTGLPTLRENGAAYATTVGFLVAAALNLWMLRRHFALRLAFRENIYRPLLASILMGLVLYLVSPLSHAIIPWGRIAGLATIGVGGLVYAVAVLALGGVRESDLQMVAGKSGRLTGLLKRLRLLRGE
ncbi:MAG: putative polysaccharide biosynthesis protein [Bacillota bacterium]